MLGSMRLAEAPKASGMRTPTRRPTTWMPLLMAAGSAAAVGVFLLLPYYANGLDRFPLEEVASGLHDPKELWPFDQGAIGGLFMLGAYATMTLGPPVAALAAGWAGFEVWRNRAHPDRRRVGFAISAVILAALTWAWCLSPLGGALIGWMLD
jgi:hypothetical protein